MFYSHDLLGRKTPLGAIWCVAREPVVVWLRAEKESAARPSRGRKKREPARLLAPSPNRTLAHGKKLSKSKIMSIDLQEIWCVRARGRVLCAAVCRRPADAARALQNNTHAPLERKQPHTAKRCCSRACRTRCACRASSSVRAQESDEGFF